MEMGERMAGKDSPFLTVESQGVVSATTRIPHSREKQSAALTWLPLLIVSVSLGFMIICPPVQDSLTPFVRLPLPGFGPVLVV